MDIPANNTDHCDIFVVCAEDLKTYSCLDLVCNHTFLSRSAMILHFKTTHDEVKGAILEQLFPGEQDQSSALTKSWH